MNGSPRGLRQDEWSRAEVTQKPDAYLLRAVLYSRVEWSGLVPQCSRQRRGAGGGWAHVEGKVTFGPLLTRAM